MGDRSTRCSRSSPTSPGWGTRTRGSAPRSSPGCRTRSRGGGCCDGFAPGARLKAPGRLMRDASAMGAGDTAGFIKRIQALDSDPFTPARGLFERDTEVVVARAPGRLDVMGGIADYSGALVLQWPIREATCAAVQVHPERVLRIVSLSDNGTSRHCTVPLDAIA